jgi:hypothetical protein
MEYPIGNHDISSEPVQTLVMPTNAGTAALRTFLPLKTGQEVLALDPFLSQKDYCQITRTPSNFLKLNED